MHAGRTPRFESERIFDAPKLAADKMALPEQLEEERLRCTLRLEALENRLRGTRPARLLHTRCRVPFERSRLSPSGAAVNQSESTGVRCALAEKSSHL